MSSHVEDKTVKAPLPPPQNIEKEDQHHDYVEEEEDPEELDNVTPDHDHNDHEEKLLEDEDELLMGSEIVDHEGEKPTGGIEFSDEEEDD